MSGADADCRSTLTFLFTDIEGSTRQWEECPTMRARVDHHFAVLRTAVDDAGGEVFDEGLGNRLLGLALVAPRASTTISP